MSKILRLPNLSKTCSNQILRYQISDDEKLEYLLQANLAFYMFVIFLRSNNAQKWLLLNAFVELLWFFTNHEHYDVF